MTTTMREALLVEIQQMLLGATRQHDTSEGSFVVGHYERHLYSITDCTQDQRGEVMVMVDRDEADDHWVVTTATRPRWRYDLVHETSSLPDALDAAISVVFAS